MGILGRDSLQVIEDSKLALEDGKPLHDGQILGIASKLGGDRPPDTSADGSIDDEPLREDGVSVFGDGGDDGIPASWGLAQRRLGEVAFVECCACCCHFGWRLERRLSSAENGHGEVGGEKGADDVWTEIFPCPCSLQVSRGRCDQ